MEKNEIKLTGNLLHFNQKNLNGRIYTKEIAESIVDQFNNIVEEGGQVFGELGYPEDWNADVNFTKVSHEVLEIKINEESQAVEGTLLVLDTQSGRKVMEMLQDSSPLGISCRPRGFGEVNESGEIENFKLISFDLVPTHTDAFANIKENDILNLFDNE
jgi:hypothetical protein